MVFTLFITFVILLRISELILARRNEKWLLQNGAKEYGKEHYPYIVALHVSFFISLVVEYSLKGSVSWSMLLLILYFLLIVCKGWVIFSLGKFWNTKIYRIPKSPLVKKGPYKYIRHPNYVVVVFELILIPLVFELYLTAALFTILNAIMLTVRIKAEEKAFLASDQI
jgi:methyltransferase